MPARTPTVSIAIPVFNGEQHLREAIDSLLAQTFADFELILLDNASTDATEEICRRAVAEDDRVRYVRNPANIGGPANYTRAFGLGAGRYFKWASANDVCAPQFLQACVAVLEARDGVVLCYPRTQLFESEPQSGRPYEDRLSLEEDSPANRFRRVLETVSLNNPLNGVIRRSALAMTRLIPMYHSSDIVLLAELALLGRFVEVPERLFYRRMDQAAATALMDLSSVERYVFRQDRGPMLFQTWRQEWGFFSACLRHRLAWAERGRIIAYLLRHAYWRVPALVGDLQQALRAKA